MSSACYWLTIDGSPFVFGSGAATLPTAPTDPDWPAGAVLLPRALSDKKLLSLSWSEELAPTQGKTTIGSITLGIDDIAIPSGADAGKPVGTWLFSRAVRSIPNAPLASAIGPTSTSIVVTSDPGFSTGAQVIWIDREAILCSSYNAGTKTFTVSPSGRGYLGTKAVSHTPEPARAFTPLVWSAWPNPQRRRAILWIVLDGAAPRPIYRGYLARAPRLDATDNTTWELHIDSAWATHSGRALGPSVASPRIVGFQPETLRVNVSRVGFAGSTVGFWSALREPYTGPRVDTLIECISLVTARMRAQLESATVGSFSCQISANVEDDRAIVDTVANALHQVSVFPGVPGGTLLPTPAGAGEDVPFQSVESGVGVWQHTSKLRYPARAHVLLKTGLGGSVPVDSVIGLPLTGLSTAYLEDGGATRVAWCLGGQVRDVLFHLELFAVDPTTRTVSGALRLTRANYGRNDAEWSAPAILLTEPTTTQLVTRVSSSHWLRAIQRGALATGYGIEEQARAEDWTWVNVGAAIDATAGERTTARAWVFDGSQKLGAFIEDACRIDVCAVATRGTRLAIVPFSPPLESDPSDYVYNAPTGEVVANSLPGYSTLPEGIVNSVRLVREAAAGPNVTVNNQQSVAMYGVAPPLEIQAKGATTQSIEDLTPFELERGPLARILGTWAEPSEVIPLVVPLDAIEDTELCKIVEIRAKTIPDGLGSRGVVTTRRGRVIRREPQIGRGVINLTVHVFPHRVSGYAPAVRVDSFDIIGGGDTKIILATNYLTDSATATDHAGSNLSSYRGVPNDGGAFHWKPGDIGRFRVVDSTTVTEEGGWEVIAVDPNEPSITVAGNVGALAYDWPVLLGTETIDFVCDEYTSASDYQKRHAFVGSRANRNLAGDPLKEWAP